MVAEKERTVPLWFSTSRFIISILFTNFYSTVCNNFAYPYTKEFPNITVHVDHDTLSYA